MSPSKLRVAVAGAGWFASRRHLPDLKARADVEVKAVCRRDRALLDRVADAFGVAGRYSDFAAMLEAEVLDAVVIATPHSLHYEQARAALERGLHVLLEKPMAIAAGEAEELKTLAEREGRVLAVALNPPYWPHTRHARALVEEGKIGRVEAATIEWVGNAEAVFGRAPLPEKMPGVVKPTLYRADHAASGGGHLIDTGSHLVSELLMLTGLPALSVSAAMDDAGIDMRASLLVSLQGGVPATITAIGDSRHPERRIHNAYFGSEGTLEISGMPFGVRLSRPGDETRTWTEKDLPPAPGPVDDFVDAVAGDRAPASTAAHGAAVTRVVEAAYRSTRTGGRIPAGRG